MTLDLVLTIDIVDLKESPEIPWLSLASIFMDTPATWMRGNAKRYGLGLIEDVHKLMPLDTKVGLLVR